MSVDRAPAQYCPYCGETDLWPHEAGHGAWECRACGRVFTVKFGGLAGRAVRGDASSADITAEPPAPAGSPLSPSVEPEVAR